MNAYIGKIQSALLSCCLSSTINLYSQIPKLDKDNLEAVNVSVSVAKMMGKEVIKVIKDPSIKAVDEPTYTKIKGIEFKNGTIEVKVLSRLIPNAADSARGFIGVAFRI